MASFRNAQGLAYKANFNFEPLNPYIEMALRVIDAMGYFASLFIMYLMVAWPFGYIHLVSNSSLNDGSVCD